MYEYRCGCGWQDDEIVPPQCEPPSHIECPHCGGDAKRRGFIAIARCPGLWAPVGEVIPALGGLVKGSRDFDRRMEERGLVRAEDVEDRVDSIMSKNEDEAAQFRRDSEEIRRRTREYGGGHEAEANATAEVYNPHRLEAMVSEGTIPAPE